MYFIPINLLIIFICIILQFIVEYLIVIYMLYKNRIHQYNTIYTLKLEFYL
jgi:hypothetical protein